MLEGVSVILMIFFFVIIKLGYGQSNMFFILKKYYKKKVVDTCMRLLCAFLAARESPSDGGTLASAMVLEAPRNPFPRGMTRLVVTVIVCRQLLFLFLFFFSVFSHLNSVLTIKKN
jgi:hypothetical protein